MKNIIEMAQSRGSSATTRAGARRYLLAHLPGTIRGLTYADDFAMDGKFTNLATDAARGRVRFGREYTRAAWYASQWERRINARADRIAENLGYEPLTAIAARIEARIERDWPYRRAEGRWAGGEHFVDVSIGDHPRVECHTERVWSSNGKWSGNNSRAKIVVTHGAIEAFGNDLIIGGLLTLDAEQVGPREYRATWARQGRGVGLVMETGWIIRGYHSTAGTIVAARKQAAQARANAVGAAVAARARKNANRVKLETMRNVWVTLDDSLAAGNCRPASEEVAKQMRAQLGGDVFAVRADFLISHVSPELRARAERAAAVAMQRRA